MLSQSAPFLSPRLFAPNNILPWPPIDAFSAPLLCHFRPLQHSNYTSEYKHPAFAKSGARCSLRERAFDALSDARGCEKYALQTPPLQQELPEDN